MRIFLLSSLVYFILAKKSNRSLVLVRVADAQNPLRSCKRRGFSCVMVTSRNIGKLTGFLKVNRVTSAAVGGWEGQKITMVLRPGGSLTPFDPATNSTDYVICVKKGSKPEPCPRPPTDSSDSGPIKPKPCKPSKFFCKGKIYGEIEACGRKENSTRCSSESSYTEKPCPSTPPSSCLSGLACLLGSKCLNSQCRPFPEICLPSRSCLPKPPYPKPCFPSCNTRPKPNKKVSCCPKIPYCPTGPGSISSPCMIPSSCSSCNQFPSSSNSMSQIFTLCKKICGSSMCSPCLNPSPGIICEPLKRILSCLVDALCPCLKNKLSPCLVGGGSASGCGSRCGNYSNRGYTPSFNNSLSPFLRSARLGRLF